MPSRQNSIRCWAVPKINIRFSAGDSYGFKISCKWEIDRDERQTISRASGSALRFSAARLLAGGVAAGGPARRLSLLVAASRDAWATGPVDLAPTPLPVRVCGAV